MNTSTKLMNKEVTLTIKCQDLIDILQSIAGEIDTEEKRIEEIKNEKYDGYTSKEFKIATIQKDNLRLGELHDRLTEVLGNIQ